LHGVTGQHDAFVRALLDHRRDLRQCYKTGSQHGIKVGDGIR
jgi:hypothetical protein